MGAAMYRKTADGMARVRKGNAKGDGWSKSGKTQYLTTNSSEGIQKWAGYPSTPYEYGIYGPFTISAYPYQAVVYSHYSVGRPLLFISQTPFYSYITNGKRIFTAASDGDRFDLILGEWVYHSAYFAYETLFSPNEGDEIVEANNDLYYDNTLTAVYFAKTIEPATTGAVWRRINL
jgi:hypothetical protein